MPCGIGTVNLPFGPVTSSSSPTVIFTPLGSGIGFLPILDIVRLSSPHPAENLSAQVLLVRVAARHHTPGSGQNVDSETTQDAGDVRLPDIHPAARTRNALDRRDHRRVVSAVLQIDLDGLLRAFFRHLEIGNVAFLFQNARYFRFQLGSRHVYRRMAGLDRVANASQHVGNWIARHSSPTSSYQLALVTPGISPFRASLRKQRRQIPNLRRKARGLPQRQHRFRCRHGSLAIPGFFSALSSWDALRALSSFTSFAIFAVVAIS